VPYQRRRVGKSFCGFRATKIQTAQDSTADSAARPLIVSSMGQYAGRYGSIGLVAGE
jgi:hypothetical protein